MSLKSYKKHLNIKNSTTHRVSSKFKQASINKTVFIQREFNIRQLVIVFSFPKTVRIVFRGFRRK